MQHVPEKTHAVLGPSGWDTWGNCPGSVPLGADIPNSSSSYARLGTAAHALLEDCLVDKCDAEDLIGKEYEVEGECYTVDSEMAEAVDAALNYIRDTIQPERGDILMTEASVPLQWLTGEQDAEGTSDVIGIVDGGKTLIVADYKHGEGVMVYASEKPDEDGKRQPNGQMAMYALGRLQQIGIVYDEIETVKLVILQPRKEHIDEFELPIEDLNAFASVVTEAAGRVEINRQLHEQGEALDLNPTDKGCKFCKAKARCPALRNLTTNALAVVSSADDFEDLSLPKKASSVVVDDNTAAEKLAEVMRASDLIDDFISAVRAEVQRRLMAGDEIPGYYLGVGRAGRRRWADDDFALKELTKSGRLKMAEATEAKIISPTKAEKLLKDRPIWGKIAPLIETPAGGPSVCKEGDKNPRYILPSSTPEDFEDLTVQPDGEPLFEKMRAVANGAAATSTEAAKSALLDD